jgi:hypothetical protein
MALFRAQRDSEARARVQIFADFFALPTRELKAAGNEEKKFQPPLETVLAGIDKSFQF